MLMNFRGRVSTSSSSGVMYDIEKEIDILEAKENKLDELIYHMKSEIKTLREFEGEYPLILFLRFNSCSCSFLLGIDYSTANLFISAI